jgi:hypothetical protein
MREYFTLRELAESVVDNRDRWLDAIQTGNGALGRVLLQRPLTFV